MVLVGKSTHESTCNAHSAYASYTVYQGLIQLSLMRLINGGHLNIPLHESI